MMDQIVFVVAGAFMAARYMLSKFKFLEGTIALFKRLRNSYRYNTGR